MNQIEEEKNKVIKQIELLEIKKLVEKYYGFKLDFKNRHRELIYALKVYSQLARKKNHTYKTIGESVGKDHATILYHYNSFYTIKDYDLNIYNECLEIINNFNFNSESNNQSIIVKMKEKKILQLEKEIKSLKEKIKEYDKSKKILDLFNGWTYEQEQDFIEYRLKPYSKLINVKNK